MSRPRSRAQSRLARTARMVRSAATVAAGVLAARSPWSESTVNEHIDVRRSCAGAARPAPGTLQPGRRCAPARGPRTRRGCAAWALLVWRGVITERELAGEGQLLLAPPDQQRARLHVARAHATGRRIGPCPERLLVA